MELWHYLSDPSFRDIYVDALIAGTAVVVMCGVLSPLVVVRRLGFIGQGVSHSAFGGIGVAAMLTAYGVINGDRLARSLGRLGMDGLGREDATSLAEFVVIVVYCVAAALGMGRVAKRRTLPEDTAIGMFLVGSMALGAVLVQVSQEVALERGVSMGNRSWESILFGSILVAGEAGVIIGVACAAGVLGALAWWRRPLLFHVFDEDSAVAFGVASARMRALLMVLLAVAVVTAMKLAGVVLATALLVLPGAIALRLSRRLGVVTAISVGTGLIGLVGGLALSAELNWQPGPSVVLVLVGLFAGAWALGKKR